MPRQNFISKEFFVNASEREARSGLVNLHHCSQQVKFVNEHSLTHSYRFLYQPSDSRKNFQIDIALLPLDSSYTQVNLHLAYASGGAIQMDTSIRNALSLFEQMIDAGIRGDASSVFTNRMQEPVSVWKTWVQQFQASFLGRKKQVANG